MSPANYVICKDYVDTRLCKEPRAYTWPDITLDLKQHKDKTKVIEVQIPGVVIALRRLQTEFESVASGAGLDGGVLNEILDMFVGAPSNCSPVCPCIFVFFLPAMLVPLFWPCGVGCCMAAEADNLTARVDFMVARMHRFNKSHTNVKVAFASFPPNERCLDNDWTCNRPYMRMLYLSIFVLDGGSSIPGAPSVSTMERVVEVADTSTSNLRTMDKDAAMEYLTSQELRDVAVVLHEKGFDGRAIAELTDADLKEEFPSISLLDRKKLLAVIRDALAASASKSSMVLSGGSNSSPMHPMETASKDDEDKSFQNGFKEGAGSVAGQKAAKLALSRDRTVG